MIIASLPHPVPNETAEYRTARNKLLQMEADLRDQVASLARARAALPPGGEVTEDYTFTAMQDGKIVEQAMSGLFGDHDSLMIYSFMYGPDDKSPCPMCTSFLDSLNGAAHHIEQRTALAIVASAPIGTSAAFADQRGWNQLQMISSSGNAYNRDYFGESPEGEQLPICNVFQKRRDKIHHFWSSELFFAKVDGQPRHVDTIWPLWNVFDLLPQGRGTDWYPAIDYTGPGNRETK